MNELNKLLDKYTLKYSKKINQLIEPLNRISGIHGIFRYTISTKGHFTFIGNSPEWNAEYYANQYFMHNPFLRHPKLLRAGPYFSKLANDEKYLDFMTLRKRKFNVDHSMILISQNEQGIEAFGFWTDSANDGIYKFYQNEMPLIMTFIDYFKEEMKSIIASMNQDQVNIGKVKGKLFYEGKIEESFLSLEKKVEFFKALGIKMPSLVDVKFSMRDKQLMALLKKGRSAAEMAEILFLSRRTIEFYLDKLKSKLYCRKKSELIDRILEMEKLGLLNL